MEDLRKYLSPQALAKLQGLEVRARAIVEGYVAGAHRSPRRGFSIEFVEHRNYSPGDDVRHIDWKVFGKTDKYYLKQFEEETNLVSHMLVDASESMRYRSSRAALSKLEYAECTAAALAWLVLEQRDSAGLVTFDSQVRSVVRPSSSASHFRQLVHVLGETTAQQKSSLGPIFHDVAERIKRRGLLAIFSDFFDDVASIISGLKHFRHRRHEVIVFHVLDPDEIDFPFHDPTLFRGLEGWPDTPADPRALRRAYLKEVETFTRELRGACADLRIDYVPLRTDESFEVPLSHYLSARMAGAH